MSVETPPRTRTSRIAPAVLVVMGVSGSGKLTVGALLAAQLRWGFEDADRFHSAANVDKMRRGIPLTDADRWAWLASRLPSASIGRVMRAGTASSHAPR